MQDAADGRGIVVYVRHSNTDQDGTAADVRYLKNGCVAAMNPDGIHIDAQKRRNFSDVVGVLSSLKLSNFAAAKLGVYLHLNRESVAVGRVEQVGEGRSVAAGTARAAQVALQQLRGYLDTTGGARGRPAGTERSSPNITSIAPGSILTVGLSVAGVKRETHIRILILNGGTTHKKNSLFKKLGGTIPARREVRCRFLH